MDKNELTLKVLRGELPFSVDGIDDCLEQEDDEEDIYNDEIPVSKLKQDFFYVITNSQLNKTSLPDFVFPEFRQMFDMMEILDKLCKGWQVGRIPIKGDFFVARQPYLKRFIKRQTKSLKVFEKVFGAYPNDRPTSKISDEALKELEKNISWCV